MCTTDYWLGFRLLNRRPRKLRAALSRVEGGVVRRPFTMTLRTGSTLLLLHRIVKQTLTVSTYLAYPFIVNPRETQVLVTRCRH
jgi:hypothetical protein